MRTIKRLRKRLRKRIAKWAVIKLIKYTDSSLIELRSTLRSLEIDEAMESFKNFRHINDPGYTLKVTYGYKNIVLD